MGFYIPGEKKKMAWIESHTNLIRHHKVIRLAKELNIKAVLVIGYLHCLWHNVLELREDGDISDWTSEEIAFYANYQKGNNDYFYNCLKQGWIDEKNGYKLLHNWLDYAGRYLQTKYRSNPEKYKIIQEKHSQTAQTDSADMIPYLPYLPNIPNHSKQPSAVKTALKEVFNKGFNIYSLINKMKKQLKWAKTQEFPEEVLLGVCSAYLNNKEKILNDWAWFVRVLKVESEQYQAKKNIAESEKFKEKGCLSLAEILKGMK